MDYVLLKQVHFGLAIVSISGFVLRWVLEILGFQKSKRLLIRAAPHIIDTLFFLAGVMLLLAIDQYPWTTPWIAAKLAGLITYILCGKLALSVKQKKLSTIAFIGALAAFTWIISVALLKSPYGFLRHF
jgi:uncharacterized membrane protein SirB2